MWVIIKVTLHLSFCRWIKDIKYLEKWHGYLSTQEMQINNSNKNILYKCFYHSKSLKN